MNAKGLTPILNVSDIIESFTWFEKLGWEKSWDWGDPPTFGCVCSGECEIFLCEGGQGGRGRGENKMTFGEEDGQTSDKGVWMSIWVDDVDAVHARCIEQGIDVTWPPTDMPWNVREMHLRHPDGHVFRISRGIKDD
jgi:hypothetical protein